MGISEDHDYIKNLLKNLIKDSLISENNRDSDRETISQYL